MRAWAQRTARWTVKTLPFSFGRAADMAADMAADVAGSTSAGQHPSRPGDDGERRHPMREPGATAPARGRHAAPSRSRWARVRDAG